MNTHQILFKCGFIEDKNNLQLKKMLKNDMELKEVHIDVYPDNPFDSSSSFMLSLRASEKNIMVSNDENRLVLKKNDDNKTYFMNILFSKITECFYNISENYFEFILNIRNTYYIVTVLN